MTHMLKSSLSAAIANVNPGGQDTSADEACWHGFETDGVVLARG
jgi:hypothetical protein